MCPCGEGLILTIILIIRMIARQRKKTLQPIVNSISTRNIPCPTTHSKRSSSLKPLSCKATVPSELPPLKHTLYLKRPHNTASNSGQSRHSSKNGFDERIFNSKVKSMGKVCIPVELKKVEGMSRQQLFLRKESHLNTYFNKRKSRLKEIVQENKRIYVKINSQKSLYSSRQLNKSYDSNADLSRRLSSSKLSRTSSTSSRKGQTKVKAKTKPKQIKIESLNINKVQDGQIHRYLNIFCNNASIRQVCPRSHKEKALPLLPSEKQNKPAHRQMSKLERIVEEFNTRCHKKPNLLLGRLL